MLISRIGKKQYFSSMKKRILIFGSIAMALAVIFEAVGSHMIHPYITEKQFSNYNIAARYHIYHSLSLLILTALAYRINSGLYYLSCHFFMAGILLFSGSLYLLSLIDVLHLSGMKTLLVSSTPIGGSFFILGWILISVGIFKGKTKKT